jgi:glycine/D-amino acid oxidase-like deaminating enzyme
MRPLSCAALGAPPWEPVRLPPQASLPESADVVIVGGGLTGLLIAAAVAHSWREVVVLDQAFGAGATARSGGVVLGETARGPAPEFTGCEESCRQWIGEHRIDCALEWRGCLELLRDPALPPSPVDWHDQGEIRLRRRVNGGVLDPARLLEGVMAVAARRGARLVNAATVTGVKAGRAGLLVRTPAATIAARKVIMATDAMLVPAASPRDPWENRAITVAIQTHPLDTSTLAAVGLAPHLAFYTDDLPLLWGRVMPDSSLLVGRELVPACFDAPPDILSSIVETAGGLLADRARRLHPALAPVTLRRVWGGPIATTPEGTPAVIRDTEVAGLFWAGGYGGQGIAQAFRVAQLAAEAIGE